MKASRGLPAQAGFTLIELLVVIAIIGLLASIVLASLNTARNKGKDAAIESEINQLATMAELAYPDSGSYQPLQPNQWIAQTVPDCSSLGFTGNYAAQAKAICAQIIANTGTTDCKSSGAHCFYAGITGAAPYLNDHKKYYSFMAFLPGASAQSGTPVYVCAGASGGRYVGVWNPGGVNWGGSGCYANP